MSVRRRQERDPKTGAPYEVWIVDVVFQHPDGRRQRIKKKSPVSTRRGAEEYERQIRNALLGGTYRRREVEVPRFEEFAREFLETYARANNKPSEIRGKECILNGHLLPHFGKLRLNEISTLGMERFKANQLDQALHPKTINNQLAVLRTMLNVAKQWSKLSVVPEIKLLKVPLPKTDFLTFEEADRLVDGAEDEPEWQSMIIVALNTGLRLGELLALRWEDCDFVVNNVTVSQSDWQGHVGPPKSGHGRVIPLNGKARAALVSQRHLKSPLVWCQSDGTPYHKDHLQVALGRMRRRAELRHFEWHVLRHSFASHLAMRGVSLKAIQELMGHASIEMTMRYAHLTPEVRRSAVDALMSTGHGPVTARQALDTKTGTHGEP